MDLALQKNRPELLSRVYNAPVMDLARRQHNAERYRNEGDPISIFDRSAKTAPFTRNLLESPAMTHPYGNNAKQFKPD